MAHKHLGFLSKTSVALVAFVIIWVLAFSFGFAIMANYESRRGPTSSAPESWPFTSTIRLDSSRPTLLLFVHPHCPCSRASITELTQLLTRIPGRLGVRIIFYRPADFPDEWSQTDLWRNAAMLQGAILTTDPNGAEANRFHATISGQALLYDLHGHLVFSGGITAGRGHVGDNAGIAAISALLTSTNAEQFRTPVYGCYLQTQTLSTLESTRP